MANRIPFTTQTEKAHIRSQLMLRKNCLTDSWEVYTTIHGTGIFRWYPVSDGMRLWYLTNFPEMKMAEPVNCDMESGGIHDELYNKQQPAQGAVNGPV